MRAVNAVTNVVVVVLVILVVIGGVLFFGSKLTQLHLAAPAQPVVPTSEVAGVHLQAQGPIVANENYVSLVLDVSATGRTLTVYLTYTNQVIDSIQLNNNQTAYNQFLDALVNAGFVGSGRNRSTSTADSNCPQGTRLTYTSTNASGTQLSSLWQTSCGSPGATFSGDTGLVDQLFKAQFPTINQLGNEVTQLQQLTW